MCNDPELHDLYEQYLLLSPALQRIAKARIRILIDSLLIIQKEKENAV